MADLLRGYINKELIMKANKYRNTKHIIDGITFDSAKEANRYGELKLLKRSGIISNFELQPQFPYWVCYGLIFTERISIGEVLTHQRKYIADFKVIYPDGHIEIEDVKGFRTAEYKRKKKIIEKLYNIKIIEK